MTANPTDDALPGLVINMVHDDGETRLILRGEIDLAVRGSLGLALQEAAGAGRPIVVDLSMVGFIDSTGISTFLEARRRGTHISLVNAQRAVRRAFEASGTDEILHVARDGSSPTGRGNGS